MVKNCDRGLENTARSRRLRAAFQDQGKYIYFFFNMTKFFPKEPE